MAGILAAVCNDIIAVFKREIMDPRNMTWEGPSLAKELSGRSNRYDQRQTAEFLQLLLQLGVFQAVETKKRHQRWKLLMPDAKVEQDGTKLKVFRHKKTT